MPQFNVETLPCFASLGTVVARDLEDAEAKRRLPKLSRCAARAWSPATRWVSSLGSLWPQHSLQEPISKPQAQHKLVRFLQHLVNDAYCFLAIASQSLVPDAFRKPAASLSAGNSQQQEVSARCYSGLALHQMGGSTPTEPASPTENRESPTSQAPDHIYAHDPVQRCRIQLG